MANNTKKYVSLSKLSTFLDNLKETFSSLSHKHTISDLTDYTVDSSLSSTSTNPVQNKVLNDEFEAIATGMNALEQAIDGKADSTHNHDSVYYTQTQLDQKLASKSDTAHNHDSDYDAKGTAEEKAADSLASAKSYTDTKVADLASTTVVDNKISSHNTSTSAHNDIRDLINGLTTRLNTLANSDDTTLDQMSEVVEYIKNNKSLIDGITTSKVNVSDIIDNLTTNVANKPLSAAQGVAIKALIDALQAELDSHTHTVANITDLTATATELNYMDGVTSNVQTQLDGKASSSHNHSASNITSGTLSTDRLPTIPIENGGTGGADVAEARTNLGLDKSITLKTVEAKLPSSDTWVKACYGNGKFVVVATSSDTCIYSENGINWQQATLPIYATWRGVAYGNGVFVAIAHGSETSAYSIDGATWSATTLPLSASWFDVAFGNGKFVATSSGMDAAYSTDGITWNHILLPINFGYNITYGNGKFVVVANSGNAGAYSYDGIDWHTMTMPTSGSWNDVAYGNGKFVAIKENSASAAYSEDGIRWVETDLPSALDWNGLSYDSDNDIFIVVANDSDVAAYSYDGINWMNTTMPMVGNWRTTVYGNGRLVAMEFVGKDVALSNDGINWSTYGQVVQDVDNADMTAKAKEAFGIPNTFITHGDIDNSIALAHNWTLIYDSGEIPAIANSISGIDVSGYTNFEVLVRCYNDGDSYASRTGSAIFTAQNGTTYQFPVWTNMFTKSISTASVMAQFKLVDGWLVCPYASKLTGDIDIFSSTEGGTAGNLTPTGSGMMKCTSPLSTLTISNLDQNSDYYFGSGSRVMVWGWKA